MSGNHQMHTHYVNAGYPYSSPGTSIDYSGGITHVPTNYAYPGPLNNQESMYWSMNMNPYRYGFFDRGSTSYSYGSYEVNDQFPINEVNQRVWQYSAPVNVEEPTSNDAQCDENAASSSDESEEECAVGQDPSDSEEDEVWLDDVDPDNMTYEELLDLGEAVGTQSRGLSQELIKMLPISWYKTSGFFSRKKPKERCVICLSTYKIGDQQMTLPCKHAYHKKCGARWLSINKMCPVCNREVFGNEAQQRQ